MEQCKSVPWQSSACALVILLAARPTPPRLDRSSTMSQPRRSAGNFTHVVFDFKLSPALIVEGVALALVVGLIGGLLPALRAAWLSIVQGFYAS